VYNIQRQLYLEQTPINEGVGAVLVETRSRSNDVIFPGPDCAFRAVGLLLVRGHDVPFEIEFTRKLSHLWTRLIIHSNFIDDNVVFAKERDCCLDGHYRRGSSHRRKWFEVNIRSPAGDEKV
jgi:hypothetical protein